MSDKPQIDLAHKFQQRRKRNHQGIEMVQPPSWLARAHDFLYNAAMKRHEGTFPVRPVISDSKELFHWHPITS